jgi:hypothetical protein
MNVKTFKFNDCNLNTDRSKTSKRYAEQKEKSQLWDFSVKNMGHGKSLTQRSDGLSGHPNQTSHGKDMYRSCLE